MPSRCGWKNDSVVWKAETSGSLREVAFSFCILTINMCICAMCSYTSRTWYLHPRAQRRCFGEAAPVVVASSYHHLCSSSTRRCGSHKTGALTETWSVLIKSRRGCMRVNMYRRVCFIHLLDVLTSVCCGKNHVPETNQLRLMLEP